MNLSDHDSSDFLTRAYVRAGKVLESRYHKAYSRFVPFLPAIKV